MPEWNGLKAADEISKGLPGVKIVLHTICWSAVGLEAKKHRICRVVEKAKTDALVSTIDELIGANAALNNCGDRNPSTRYTRQILGTMRSSIKKC